MIMMVMDIFSLFFFVLSILYVVNLIFGIVKNILSENPRHLVYGIWEKISNYFFISYLITYILIKLI
jgi:hypothetical protein